MITYSKSVSGLSPERGWNTKDLFFIPRTHAESGVLAKMRPAHTRIKDIWEDCYLHICSQIYNVLFKNIHPNIKCKVTEISLTMSVALLQFICQPQH